MSLQDTKYLNLEYNSPNGRIIKFANPLVMGIVNITDDSFYDGGLVKTKEDFIKRLDKHLTEGADIIDIGAMSSKPGAIELPLELELERIKDALNWIREINKSVLVSVDTYRAEVAEEAIKQDADIINDISAGNFDANMIDVVAKYNCPYIMMHMKGKPKNMQNNPSYNNVVEEVKAFFESKIADFRAKLCKQLIIDLGYGFGKTIEHNYELLNKQAQFADFGLPILTGISRKSMIYKLLNITPAEALNGTSVLNTIALQNAASILRVHDVKEAKEVIRLLNH